MKAEYLYQPRLLLQRLGLLPRPKRLGRAEYVLPWGHPIMAHAEEEHGRKMELLGLSDLAVTETLWRLSESTDTLVDAGANIGCMSSIMAHRLLEGAKGRLMCFEPHPEIFAELAENINRWREMFGDFDARLYPIALSSRRSSVPLNIPVGFDHNRGLATLSPADESSAGGPGEYRSVMVETGRLDDLVGEGESVGVLKIDVEGHELEVLRGAERLLSSRSIRDCVFEELRMYPTEVTDLLEEHGYKVFGLRRGIAGLRIVPPDKPEVGVRWEPQNFLATIQPDRAGKLMRPRGWQVLSGRRRVRSAGDCPRSTELHRIR